MSISCRLKVKFVECKSSQRIAISPLKVFINHSTIIYDLETLPINKMAEFEVLLCEAREIARKRGIRCSATVFG